MTPIEFYQKAVGAATEPPETRCNLLCYRGRRRQPALLYRRCFHVNSLPARHIRAVAITQSVALIVLCRCLVVRLAIELSAPERDGRRIATALRVLIVATRLEPGCLSCTLWTELGEDFRVHYEERWRSEEAMRQRVLSDAFTKLLEVLEASPARPSVEFDFVAKRMGLEYIEMVRSDDPVQPSAV